MRRKGVAWSLPTSPDLKPTSRETRLTSGELADVLLSVQMAKAVANRYLRAQWNQRHEFCSRGTRINGAPWTRGRSSLLWFCTLRYCVRDGGKRCRVRFFRDLFGERGSLRELDVGRARVRECHGLRGSDKRACRIEQSWCQSSADSSTFPPHVDC